MAYISNIPQSSDTPSFSQPQLLGNFQALATWGGVNHIGPTGTDASYGMHLMVQMPVPQTSLPVQQGSQEWDLFTQAKSGGDISLYVQRPSGNTQYASRVFDVGSYYGTTLMNGLYTYLPSGVLIQWGTGLAGSGAGGTVFLPASYASTTSYVVQTTLVSPTSNVAPIVITNASVNSFTAVCQSGNASFSYVAIGLTV